MNKAEFIAAVAEKSGESKKMAARMWDAAQEVITTTVASGESVQFVGFGTFKARVRKAYTGVNPQTKTKLKIPKTTIPVFKPGSTFKTLVATKAKKKK